MTEGEPKRRGRPRRTEAPPAPAAPAQVETQPTNAPEATVENPVDQITHRYLRGIYREGADVLGALDTAQTDLFSQAGVAESFATLNSLVGLGLEVARETSNQSLIDNLTGKQRAFSSALRRLGTSGEVFPGSVSAPRETSSLPPMTGRKG